MNFTETELMMMEDKPRFLNDDEKKLRKKCKKRIEYLKNKEYYQDYYQENKEEIRENQNEYKKEYYQKNKEEILEEQKDYYHKNKDRILENQKEYRKTEKGYKQRKRHSWEQQGLNMDNFEEIFKRYYETDNCDFCGIKLVMGIKMCAVSKCMDHDHNTGEFRNILCSPCNTRRK